MMGFNAYRGEAMSMGEKPTVALFDAPASGRSASAKPSPTSRRVNVATSATSNSPPAGWPRVWQRGRRRKNSTAPSKPFPKTCRVSLKHSVGKDSLSMKTVWQDGEEEKSNRSPLGLIISASAPVKRRTQTAVLKTMPVRSSLLMIDLGNNRRMGGSALAQTV